MHYVQSRCLDTKAVEVITVTLAATAEGKAVAVEMTEAAAARSAVDPAHQAGIVQEVLFPTIQVKNDLWFTWLTANKCQARILVEDVGAGIVETSEVVIAGEDMTTRISNQHFRLCRVKHRFQRVPAIQYPTLLLRFVVESVKRHFSWSTIMSSKPCRSSRYSS